MTGGRGCLRYGALNYRYAQFSMLNIKEFTSMINSTDQRKPRLMQNNYKTSKMNCPKWRSIWKRTLGFYGKRSRQLVCDTKIPGMNQFLHNYFFYYIGSVLLCGLDWQRILRADREGLSKGQTWYAAIIGWEKPFVRASKHHYFKYRATQRTQVKRIGRKDGIKLHRLAKRYGKTITN